MHALKWLINSARIVWRGVAWHTRLNPLHQLLHTKLVDLAPFFAPAYLRDPQHHELRQYLLPCMTENQLQT